jgi:hypothetical protein
MHTLQDLVRYNACNSKQSQAQSRKDCQIGRQNEKNAFRLEVLNNSECGAHRAQSVAYFLKRA